MVEKITIDEIADLNPEAMKGGKGKIISYHG